MSPNLTMALHPTPCAGYDTTLGFPIAKGKKGEIAALVKIVRSFSK